MNPAGPRPLGLDPFGPYTLPMKLIHAVFATLALAATVPAAAQEPEKPAKVQGYLTLDGLKDEIDLSLRWLRSQQDLKSGSYGGVETTARVLLAFAVSPRGYHYEDGPYISKAVDHLLALQRDDGAICEPKASRMQSTVQTATVIETLRHFKDRPEVAVAVQRAEAFYGRPVAPVSWEESLAPYDDAYLLRKAEDELWERKDEGWWEHPFNKVDGTARVLGRLNAYYGVLKKRKGPSKAGVATPLPALAEADRGKAVTSLGRGATFLLSTAENGRWGFPGRPDPGITAMVTGALLGVPEPRPAEVQKAIDGALDWLVSLQREDGSIHAGQLANYVTSASILALKRGGRAQDKPVIERAGAFLQELQADEGEGYNPSDLYYGGVGYGGDERPDLSNLQMALEALNAAGVEPGDPTLDKALAFLQRCQNRSESNDVAVVRDGVTTKSGDDGGSGYAPGESKAGFIALPDGTKVPRSYGSMTYALLKGYLFAGLPKDDPRVQAAWKWLQANYTLEINPGFEASADPTAAYQGLFYYFYTMARALDLYGAETVTDAAGQAHAWRSELIGRILPLQRQDGSWINENAERWYEGNPVLATAYAMLTLDVALPAPQPAAGD